MLRPFLLASVALFAVPAHAEAPAPDSAADTQDHDQPNAEIVITGTSPRASTDLLGGTAVLAEEELTRELRPTIGETLARQPGVSSTSFGPNASRPVLRGFTGDRAPVLTDGIGSIDVSNSSADHAVVINPLTADRIEVLRGPAALMFGPSAIGGVVNVIDSRIPRRMVEEPLHLDAIGTLGSAAEERAISASADVPLSGKLLVHADGSFTETGNLRTGGPVLASGLRAQAAASADPAIRALADLDGEVPNTAGRTWDVAGGFALVDDRGNLGVSVGHFDSLYGVPVRWSLDPAIEAEEVRLHAEQTRVDIRGEVTADAGPIHRIRLRLAGADYRHSELEDTGEVGTTFFSQGMEGRLELVQQRYGGWEGLVGAQLAMRDMRIVGEEKFLPQNSSARVGLFTLQSLDLGAVKAEAAARYEHARLSAHADADIGNPAYDRTFNSFSASAGASYALVPGVRFGVNVSRSERAPTPEELFANGPHAGTQAFEIGNPGFDTEKAWGVEATLKGTGDGWSFTAAGYANWFDGYIFDAPTGATEDDLPVFQYRQADARYYGFEVEGSVRVAQAGDFAVNVDGLADYVQATIVDGGVDEGPAPRIPPLRLLGGIEAQSDRLTGRVEVEHSFEQDRVSGVETPTDGYTLFNASVAWTPGGAGSGTTLSLSANNIFDVEARRHASVLKDYAPLAGRDIRLTARFRI